MSRIGETKSHPTAPLLRPLEQTPAVGPRATGLPDAQIKSCPVGHISVSEFVLNPEKLLTATNAANAAGVPSGISGMFSNTPPNLSLGLNGLNVLGSLAAVPLSAEVAYKDITAAQADPNQSTLSKAAASAVTVPRNTLAAAGAVFSASQANTYRHAHKAAEGAFRAAAPNASETAVRAASREAAKSSLDALNSGIRANPHAARPINSAGVGAVEGAVSASVRNSRKDALKTIMGVGDRTVARPQLQVASNRTARAATTAAVHSGAGTLGRAAARFAPGVNVAVAAMDVGIAAATWANPKSSNLARATSTVTAAGSILAATNIPFLSQGGAALSVASSFVGGVFERD
ncbi:hypothetical protein [Stigmatella erecta]|uniref:Uncharacterized protein n=1 Tax=Stigmatella erecta TaxID=83460 RepID=A0A1I0KFK0_9BACT|nr:hypothetical protein [Stigmatella erecta]SEU23290.1 hypothetical protein SAMN05443639_110230 [Stigmatella erecta]